MNIKVKLPPGWEDLREKFMETEDLILMDGTYITPEEMWDYACLPFTGRYRYAVDHACDLELINIIRHKYLAFSCEDRVKKMREKGMPSIYLGDMIAGFPSLEIVYGCHGIICTATIAINEIVWNGARDYMEKAAQWCSFEACPGEPTMALMARDGKIPTDLILTGIGEGCSATQMIREWPIPIQFIDVPFNGKGREWALEYLTEQVRIAVDKISGISGRKVTTDDLNHGIKMMDEVYDTCREYVEVTASAEVPPIAAAENLFVGHCMYDCCGDPVALANANRSLIKELKERVRKGIRAPGVVEDPIRIYVCATMLTPPEVNLLENLGATVMGSESRDALFLFDERVATGTDDPCKAVAKWYLNNSPWSNALSLEDRTEWLFEVIEKYRPEGVIFSALWGCPLGPQFGKFIADGIRKKFNIPSIVMEDNYNSMEACGDGKIALPAYHRTRLQGFVEVLGTRRKKKAEVAEGL